MSNRTPFEWKKPPVGSRIAIQDLHCFGGETGTVIPFVEQFGKTDGITIRTDNGDIVSLFDRNHFNIISVP